MRVGTLDLRICSPEGIELVKRMVYEFKTCSTVNDNIGISRIRAFTSLRNSATVMFTLPSWGENYGNSFLRCVNSARSVSSSLHIIVSRIFQVENYRAKIANSSNPDSRDLDRYLIGSLAHQSIDLIATPRTRWVDREEKLRDSKQYLTDPVTLIMTRKMLCLQRSIEFTDELWHDAESQACKLMQYYRNGSSEPDALFRELAKLFEIRS